MKLIDYTSVQPTNYDGGAAKGVAGRVAAGKADGANNFFMRVFEIAPGGHTPKHTHPWEHEIFIHSGVGEIFGNGRWNPVQAGSVVFMPPDEEHQVRNTGSEKLIFACVIPSGVPEL